MNTMHLGFGVGAVLSPLLVDRFAVATGDAATAYWLFAALMIPVAVWIYRTPSPRQPAQPGTRATTGVVRRHRWFIAVTAVFFFLHVGAELSFGGWIFSYAEEAGQPETTARLLNSFFWGGLVAGRLLAIPLSKRLQPARMLQLDLAGAIVSVALIGLFPDSSPALWIGTIGFGASVASIFASSINYAEQRMAITSHVTAVFLVGGSAGSMTLPWVVGQFFDSRGPESMTWVVGGAIIAATALFAIMKTAAPDRTVVI
jgi:fucose permease